MLFRSNLVPAGHAIFYQNMVNRLIGAGELPVVAAKKFNHAFAASLAGLQRWSA